MHTESGHLFSQCWTTLASHGRDSPGALVSDTRVEGKTRRCIYPAGLSLFGTGRFRRFPLCTKARQQMVFANRAVSIRPPSTRNFACFGKSRKSLVLGQLARVQLLRYSSIAPQRVKVSFGQVPSGPNLSLLGG